MTRLAAVLTLGAALAAPVAAETFHIDADHSSVGFRIRHLVGKTSGRFDKFSGTFDYVKGKAAAWKAEASIDPASINTANTKRDDHLRNEDFFDVAKCPKMEFKTTKVTAMKGDKAKLRGDLTMHCVTKPVTLNMVVNGVGPDPWGNRRAGITATGKVNRKEFGMSYNKVLDAGSLMLGEEVEITLEIEGIAKK